MINEALSFLWHKVSTKSPEWVYRFGFLHESIGIEARYKRCQQEWAPHLEKSKAAILAAMDKCHSYRTALIVGSGPGFDLPLEEIAKKFSRILLVDAVHPATIRKKVKHLNKKTNYGIITLIISDITELAYKLEDFTQETTIPLPQLYRDFPDIDLVVSLNVASQLPIKPLQYLPQEEQEDPNITQNIASKIIEAHLAWLSSFNAVSVLICDRQWVTKEIFQGRIVERTDPTYNVPLPAPEHIWSWNICPNAEMPDPAARRAGLIRENIVGMHYINIPQI